MTRRDLAQEPFRLFFPAAVLAGLVGVTLWPLHFKGIVAWYPGTNHARLMAFGLFGGFIFGFLGTALPRMLSSPPLNFPQVLALILIFAAMVLADAFGHLVLGDSLLLSLLILFWICMAARAKHRKDLPPPGFVLVLLAFLCAAIGAALAILQYYRDLDLFWISLQHLLAYQGFVLFPILGVGGFLLPRFFGLAARQDFPESPIPMAGWKSRAALAMSAGALILVSFWMEAAGWLRAGPCLRFTVTLAYLILEIPFFRPANPPNALATCLRMAFILLLAGLLAIAFFPAYRVSLLHLTLIGGFAVITFTVATRVVFGHSGNQARLTARNRWLLVAVGLMLFGMATRVSGDFWPKIVASHYIYGAVLWAGGVLIWAGYVLPKVLVIGGE